MIKNEKGFTLVEMLVTLSGFLLIVSLLPFLLNIHWLKDSATDGFNRLEWQVFIQQAKREVREARQVVVTARTLDLYKFNGEKVSFEKYGSMIRRRVNGQGHEIMLQHIADIQYELTNAGLRVNIVAEGGKHYEASIISFFPLKGKAP